MIRLSHKTTTEFTTYANMRIRNAYNAFFEANNIELAEDENVSDDGINRLMELCLNELDETEGLFSRYVPQHVARHGGEAIKEHMKAVSGRLSYILNSEQEISIYEEEEPYQAGVEFFLCCILMWYADSADRKSVCEELPSEFTPLKNEIAEWFYKISGHSISRRKAKSLAKSYMTDMKTWCFPKKEMYYQALVIPDNSFYIFSDVERDDIGWGEGYFYDRMEWIGARCYTKDDAEYLYDGSILLPESIQINNAWYEAVEYRVAAGRIIEALYGLREGTKVLSPVKITQIRKNESLFTPEFLFREQAGFHSELKRDLYGTDIKADICNTYGYGVQLVRWEKDEYAFELRGIGFGYDLDNIIGGDTSSFVSEKRRMRALPA